MYLNRIIILLLSFAALSCSRDYDVIVYGSTPAGITAARGAAELGRKVALVSPSEEIGGVMSGGLGYTDVGNKKAIEGLSKRFFREIGRRYGRLEQYIFEPHVASEVFLDMIDLPGITLYESCSLEGVRTSGKRIRGITVSGGRRRIRLSAEAFVDASYEGDLMAASGVSYIVGRESRDEYGEDAAGVTVAPRMMQFPDGIDPYREKGKPESGLLPGIEDIILPPEGSADSLTQAYCYRVFLTRDTANRIAFAKQEGYDPLQYELALRLLESNPEWTLKDLFIMRLMPGGKTEFNNRGGFSSDFVGGNTDYPEASEERRREIGRAHRTYIQGLFFFYANDPRVPEHVREEMSEWGYCRDEHVRSGNFPAQLYIREARRMRGESVATMRNCLLEGDVRDTVAFGSYSMDSHSVRRIVVRDSSGRAMVKNEGGIGRLVDRPYPISYSWMVPKRAECTNLVVPVCLSASHIAYTSLRIEPTFMVLGHAAGIAAAMASDSGADIQDIPSGSIRKVLAAGSDVVVDDDSALHSDSWTPVTTKAAFGPTCLERCGNSAGSDDVIYPLPDSLSGEYTLWAYVQKLSDPNSYSNKLPKDLSRDAEWVVSVGGGSVTVPFDDESFEVLGQTAGDWYPLGRFDFSGSAGASVTFRPLSGERTRTDAIMLTRSAVSGIPPALRQDF